MRRNNVQVGIAKKLRVKGRDEVRALIVDANVAKALDTPRELTVGRGKIGAPSTAKAGAALAGLQVCAAKIQTGGAGGSEPVAINQTREIELRLRLGFILRQAGKHEKYGGENAAG